MMNTDVLIRSLAANVPPVSRGAVGRRVAQGLAAGSIGTLLLVGSWLGFRTDLEAAMSGFSFWVKGIYTVSLGLLAIAGTIRLARPDPGPLRHMWFLALPVAGLAVIGVTEMMLAPADQWLGMWLGQSWQQCPLFVLLLSVPIFIGLLWSYRRMAPTRLRAAGAVAGLAAGACAATIYCLHCPEVSAIFVLTWYTLGIALAAALGALLGPRLLRW